MKIWITGCAGFLGRRLLRALSAQGHEVVGISRRTFASPARLAAIDLASPDAVMQLTQLAQTYGAADVVVHTASRQPARVPLAEYVRSNVLTTANLLDYLDTAPTCHIIYTSTMSVYGKQDVLPVSETASCNGQTIYAKTKLWSEDMLKRFSDRASVAILRLPSMYGYGQKDSFIDGLARLAMRNESIELFARGSTLRDALHVDDVVEVIKRVVQWNNSGSMTLNIGCGQPLTARQYAEALVAAIGSKSQIVPVERTSAQLFDLYTDVRKAQSEIGFTPRPLHQAMEDYANEIRSAS